MDLERNGGKEMTASQKEEQAMHDCYVQLYNNAQPKADFNELLKASPVNELGEIDIPFTDYEIDKSKYLEIVNSAIKRYGIRSSFRQKAFKVAIALGCSPKFKNDETIRISDIDDIN